MKAYISGLIADGVRHIAPQEAEGVLGASTFDVSYPKPGFGDYATNAAMVMFKQFAQPPAKSPAELAQKLAMVAMLRDASKTFSKIEAVGGFINFTLSDRHLTVNLKNILQFQDAYGQSQLGAGNKILLEYFQPNVAKPLHLGHLENGIFGDALFRVLMFTGYSVESDTHLGDWGTQFGLLLLAYKKWGDLNIIKQDPIIELNKLYVRINSEMAEEPELLEQGKEEFVKLEQRDAENVELWQQFKQWSWEEFEYMYSSVGIRRADHDWPESFYAEKMPAVIKKLQDKGVLKESQGAQIVDLEQYDLGIAVVVKSDGGTTYLLRDLATYIYRKQEGFDQQLYVVDVRQSHALAQTFKILELLGELESSSAAKHISYGFLKLPEGAMSTRKGTVVGAKELIEDAVNRAQEIIEAKNPQLPDKAQVAHQVAIAAIKYFILSRNLKDDIVFDRDQALSFEGNTGPYLQYTHARISSIYRKFGSESGSFPELGMQEANELDRRVLRKLNVFPDIVEYAASAYTPNALTTYLYELSKEFNSFYEANPVLQAEHEELKQLRMQIARATAQVLKNGLHLLGIEAPEQM